MVAESAQFSASALCPCCGRVHRDVCEKNSAYPSDWCYYCRTGLWHFIGNKWTGIDNKLPTEEDISEYVAHALRTVSGRLQSGRPVIRCQVLCSTGNQCTAYSSYEINRNHICKAHMKRSRRGFALAFVDLDLVAFGAKQRFCAAIVQALSAGMSKSSVRSALEEMIG
jgi:hypothetical protein